MESNKNVSVNKKDLRVEDGKVIIESNELIEALESEELDLYADKDFNEEANNKEVSLTTTVKF